MRIALFADIHANREALEACLAHAARLGAERHVFLGDFVGYGADPAWVVARMIEERDRGAVLVMGNHDWAIGQDADDMNSTARLAIAWTRDRLGAEAKAFLASLPMTVREDDRLYVHAEAAAPRDWTYVLSGEEARMSISATDAAITLCGHVHVPALYGLTPLAKLTRFVPVPGITVPVGPQRRWLFVNGAVGQPRDGDPAAAWALYDTAARELTLHRVPYDAAAAAAKVRAAGLPERLALRLERGE